MNDNLFTEPGPRDRLLETLDPQGQVDAGLAVTIAHDLPADTATVLAELIERRIARVLADLVLAEHTEPAEDQDGDDEPNEKEQERLLGYVKEAFATVVEPTRPPAAPAPRRHGIAELLTLVGGIRRIACDRTMAPDDQMRRIRDLFLDYDHSEDDQ